ncbi:uncharacterized protein LOC136039977 [Artemia franciscana]|uniref:Ig-like domain-containing protein n=1 Tax=Artemia franciscana TaxID=6661 RepID=A0AA88HY17_ARTSF|nr:hypothetical protein QYM36_008770 [Artemia franciscana]
MGILNLQMMSLIFFSHVLITNAMKLQVDIIVPSVVLNGKDALLECHYDLDDEGLYSLKWYKGNEEIFRFIPGEEFLSDRIKGFNLPGVKIDMERSDKHKILLQNVNFDTTGRYRCEIVAEGPSFQTMSSARHLNVVQIPSEDPIITGGQLRYSIGDTVEVNCTSKDSLPAVNLSWYINGEQVDRSHLRHYPLEEVEETGLQSTTLGLQFKVRQKHFRHGGLKIKCLATLAALYWRSDERSAEPAAMRSPHNLNEHEAYAAVSPNSEGNSNWFYSIGSGSDSMLRRMSIIALLIAVYLTHQFGT